MFAENVTGGANTLESEAEFTNATEDGKEVDTKNAIQKAVDAALAAAKTDADAELTITVEDGTYDGDILIKQNSESPSIPKTLNILAKGAFTEPS